MSNDELTIEVICRHLPGIRFADYEPVYLGIQKGNEVMEAATGDRKQAIFRPTFKIGTQPKGSPNFLGAFAKSNPRERFFYLSWSDARRRSLPDVPPSKDSSQSSDSRTNQVRAVKESSKSRSQLI